MVLVTIKEGSLSVVTTFPPYSMIEGGKEYSVFSINDIFDLIVMYIPFSYDFGPPSTGSIYYFTKTLENYLKKSDASHLVFELNDKKEISNGIVLMTGFCIFSLQWSAKKCIEIFKPLLDISEPFNDASSIEYPFQLPVVSCITSLEKASLFKWIDFKTFNYEEYTHYEKVENGDFNWIIPNKILAFCSPTEETMEDDENISYSPDYYIKYFKKHNITTVVRLCKVLYNAQKFKNHGIDHHDLYFIDGTPPTEDIVNKYINIVDNASGAVAIHCKQGLGRTGTLNACYMMKYFSISALETIAINRIQRPGSVVGPQQEFLINMESKLVNTSLIQSQSNSTTIGGLKRKISIIPQKRTKKRKTCKVK